MCFDKFNRQKINSNKRKKLSGSERRKIAKAEYLKRSAEDPKQKKLSFNCQKLEKNLSLEVSTPITQDEPYSASKEIPINITFPKISEVTSYLSSCSEFCGSEESKVVIEQDLFVSNNSQTLNEKTEILPQEFIFVTEEKTENVHVECVESISKVEQFDSSGFLDLFCVSKNITDDVIRSMIRLHPIQPETSHKNSIKLPFDINRVYFQNNQEKRIWLSFCENRKEVFCWICMIFRSPTVKIKSAFTTGWGNNVTWKSGHIYKAIERHENVTTHIQAVDAFWAFSQNKAINQLIDENLVPKRNKEVTARREIIKRIIDVIIFIGKQGISFRGARKNEALYLLHDSNNHGNFLETIKLLAKYYTTLQDHVSECIFKSKKRHEKHPDTKGRGNLLEM